jgi:hypothetical protein
MQRSTDIIVPGTAATQVRPVALGVRIGLVAWFLGFAYLVGTTGLAGSGHNMVLIVMVFGVSLLYAAAMGFAGWAMAVGRRTGAAVPTLLGGTALLALPIVSSAWFLSNEFRGFVQFELGGITYDTPSMTGLVLSLLLAAVAGPVAWRRRHDPTVEAEPLIPWIAGVGMAALATYLMIQPGLDTAALPWVIGYALFVGVGATAIIAATRDGHPVAKVAGWVTVAAFPILVAGFFHWNWWAGLFGVEVDYGWAPLLPITILGFAVTYAAGLVAALVMLRRD